MASDSPHSRNQPSGGHGARSGADRLQRAAQQGNGAGVDDADGEHEPTTQPFAGTGQFTGRPVAPQEGVDAPPPAGTDDQGPPAGTQTAGSAPAQPGIDDVSQLARERDGLRESLQRLAADFDNFRKRSVREREAAAAAADAKLLAELLVVLDDLERALAHAPHDGDAAGVTDGVRMVHSRLNDVLAKHGLSEIEATGTFDPHLHEAVLMRRPQQGEQEGQILDVAQKGYRLGDRVLRHTKVVVAGE